MYRSRFIRLLAAVGFASLMLALLTMVFQPKGRGAFAQGTPSTAGVRFDQVDFLFPAATMLNSDWGRASANPAALARLTGLSNGFLNVFTDQGWVVQNLPVA